MTRRLYIILFVCSLCFSPLTLRAQLVDFCGEAVPLEREFVSFRLMDIIKKQLRYRNFLPALKAKSEMYFPMILPILAQYDIPEDFKYLPIVESGFNNATSRVGAQGVWQLMPATAAELGLEVGYSNDERNHLFKATHAACRYLRQLYRQLHSWTLAAAAYNAGAGNISRNIRRQGKNDYYELVLNNETAQYMYKIIAVKQLFESPELYMPGFGYNVFAKTGGNGSVFASTPAATSEQDFRRIRVSIGQRNAGKQVAVYAARLQHSRDFADGQLVSVVLLDDLQANGVYIRKNSSLSGRAWLVSNRIYVDLGFGSTIILCDNQGHKGVPLQELQSGGLVKLQGS